MEKHSKDQEESTSRTTGSKSCPSGPSGIRAQEHAGGCRREKISGVGVTHHPGWERSVHREG